MTFFTFDITPDASIFVTKIAAFQHSIRSFHEPMDRSVREVLIPGIQEAFDQEGPGWAPLADSTVRIKKQLGLDRGILKRTGKLESAATALARWKFTTDSALFDNFPSKVSYGYPLNDGFINAQTYTSVPAREFIKFDSDQRAEVADIFDNWLDERRARHL